MEKSPSWQGSGEDIAPIVAGSSPAFSTKRQSRVWCAAGAQASPGAKTRTTYILETSKAPRTDGDAPGGEPAMWAVRLTVNHPAHNRKDAGSSPARPTKLTKGGTDNGNFNHSVYFGLLAGWQGCGVCAEPPQGTDDTQDKNSLVYSGIRVTEKNDSTQTSPFIQQETPESPAFPIYPRRFAARRFDSGGGEKEGKQMEQLLKMEIDGMVRALGLCQEVEGSPDACWKCPMQGRQEGCINALHNDAAALIGKLRDRLGKGQKSQTPGNRDDLLGQICDTVCKHRDEDSEEELQQHCMMCPLVQMA